MMRLTTEQFARAAGGLIETLGDPAFYSVEHRPDRIWLTWGPDKDKYPPNDKVQFGAQTAISPAVKLLESRGIKVERR